MERHPDIQQAPKQLPFLPYFWQWTKLAFAGFKGFIGDAGLILGVGFASAHSRWQAPVEAWLKRLLPFAAGYEDALAWAPFCLALIYAAVRLLLAPWRMAVVAKQNHESEFLKLMAERAAERKAATEATDELQQRIAQLQAPAPRVLVRATRCPQAPLAVKNVGPVEAHNLKIRDLEYDEYYVEFDVIDPVESNGIEKTPPFRVMERGGQDTSPFWMSHFPSFIERVDENFIDIAGRVGITADPDTWARAEWEKVFDAGSRRYPLVASYTDPTGRRRFETTYEWERPWGSSDLVLHFVGWREL